jgi:PAS domain S-box-containing protein
LHPVLVFFAIVTLFFAGSAGRACHAATGAAEVLVGYEGDFKPYSFVDEKGQPTGFGVDLITAVARTMDIPIRILPGTWDTVWHDLVEGKIDVLPVVAKLPSRLPMVEFGLSHTETFDAFIVRKGEPLIKDIAGAGGKEIIVMRSDAAHHALLEHGFQGRVVPVDTISEMLSLLRSGKHDAVLYPKLLGTMEIRERRIRGLSVGPPIPDYKRVFSFAVKKDDHELLEKLNQGLLIVKGSGEYDRIYEKWFSVDEPWEKLQKYVVPAITITLAVILGAGVWLLMLHLLVGKRTKELEGAKKSLREINATLEQRIAERTAELQIANASLREYGQRLRLVLGASSMGTFEFDVLTGEGRWNDTEFELLGLRPGDVRPGPETFFRYVHPDDLEILQEQWATALRVGTFDVQFRIVRADGEMRWLAGKGSFISRDETGADSHKNSGQALIFLGVNYDITRRKQAEESLRESELFYRQTLESIPGMVFTTRPDGYCDYQSQQWVDFTGVPMSEHLGNGWNKLLHPEDRPLAFAAWRAAVEERAPYDLEYRVRRYDGVYEWFKVRGRPIRNAAGEIVRWFGTALNIDHLLKTQEALRASEEHVRLKLDSVLSPAGDIGDLELADIIDAPAIQALVDNLYSFVHLPLWILDLKGNVLVGAGWQDICTRFHRVHPETCVHCRESDLELTRGVSAGEFQLYRCKNGMWDAVTPVMVGGQHMGNLYSGQFFFEDEPLDREFFRAQALRYGFNEEEYLAALDRVLRISREALDAGMGFYLKLAEMLSKLSYSNIKLARSLSERDALLHSLQQSEERLQHSMEDVLELSGQITARNAELEIANRELESFIYSVSHDLRAPLRSIFSFASFLEKEYSDRLDDRARDYLDRISNGSVKMSRLIEDMLHLSKVSRQEVSREGIDLSSLACSVISDLREAEPGRIVEAVIMEGLTAIADPRLMGIVLFNLLGNAWKFTAKTENARIELGAGTEEGQTVYYVRDNGAGFDPEYAARMFLPFHRLHSEDEFEGTGIGLAIVERIIQRHGGRIWAEGAPGKGATVFFTLG